MKFSPISFTVFFVLSALLASAALAFDGISDDVEPTGGEGVDPAIKQPENVAEEKSSRPEEVGEGSRPIPEQTEQVDNWEAHMRKQREEARARGERYFLDKVEEAEEQPRELKQQEEGESNKNEKGNTVEEEEKTVSEQQRSISDGISPNVQWVDWFSENDTDTNKEEEENGGGEDGSETIEKVIFKRSLPQKRRVQHDVEETEEQHSIVTPEEQPGEVVHHETITTQYQMDGDDAAARDKNTIQRDKRVFDGVSYWPRQNAPYRTRRGGRRNYRRSRGLNRRHLLHGRRDDLFLNTRAGAAHEGDANLILTYKIGRTGLTGIADVFSVLAGGVHSRHHHRNRYGRRIPLTLLTNERRGTGSGPVGFGGDDSAEIIDYSDDGSSGEDGTDVTVDDGEEFGVTTPRPPIAPLQHDYIPDLKRREYRGGRYRPTRVISSPGINVPGGSSPGINAPGGLDGNGDAGSPILTGGRRVAEQIASDGGDVAEEEGPVGRKRAKRAQKSSSSTTVTRRRYRTRSQTAKERAEAAAAAYKDDTEA